MPDLQELTLPANREVRIELSREALSELTLLKTKLGVRSNAELIRFGFKLLQWVTEQLASGGNIQVVHQGSIQEVKFSFLRLERASSPKAGVAA